MEKKSGLGMLYLFVTPFPQYEAAATVGAWKIRTGTCGALASSWETQDEVEWLVTVIPWPSSFSDLCHDAVNLIFFHSLAVFDYCNMQLSKTRVLPPHRVIYFSFLKNNIQPSSAPSYSLFLL